MKKIFAFLMVLLLICLTACSRGDISEAESQSVQATEEQATIAVLTKDEMLAQAVDADATDINNDSFDNLARAKMAYCNKILRLTGTIKSIAEDHIVLGSGSTYEIAVYLPLEELILVDSGQKVAVVGQMSDELIESSENIGEYTFEYTTYQMPQAYLVQEKFEINGVLKGVNNSYAPAFNIQIGESNYLRLIYFSDSVDTGALQFGQKIRFSAKCFSNSLGWEYRDAEIIE